MEASKTVELRKLLAGVLALVLIGVVGSACAVESTNARGEAREDVAQSDSSADHGDTSASENGYTTTTDTTSTQYSTGGETPVPQEQTVLEELPEATAAQGDGQPPALSGVQQPEIERFVSEIFSDVDAMWSESSRQAGLAYTSPYLEFVYQTVDTPCGPAEQMSGPFYCPANQTVYYTVDWTLTIPTYNSEHGAVTQDQYYVDEIGDFAVAYVVAHEIAHHLQEKIGILAAKRENRLYTIQTELQADCLAGVWANTTYHRGMLEEGDIEEGLRLAANIADLPGTPAEDPTAHGTPEQRMQWFSYGYDTGQGSKCVTY